jgi:hypothetical protein
MPTSIKQLKVINNATLSADGTFSIGLRDNLVIKPNSQVGLSKFLAKQITPISNVFDITTNQTFDLTTQTFDSVSNRLTPHRTITIAPAIYSQLKLMVEMEYRVNQSLICGDITGATTFSKFVIQEIDKPALDVGLDVLFSSTDDGLLEFNFTDITRTMCMNSNFTPNHVAEMGIVQLNDIDQNVGLIPFLLDEWWGYWSENTIVKGAFQCFTQINRVGVAGCGWYWGLRYEEDDTANNTEPVIMGVYKTPAGAFQLVDTVVVNGVPTTVYRDMNYTFTAGDFFILFTAKGQLQLQIYNGNPDTQNGVEGVVTKVFDSSTIRPDGFKNYSDFLDFNNINYRMVIAKDGNDIGIAVPTDTPYFRILWSVDRLDVPNGLKRVITMDFRNAGELVEQMGFPTQIIQNTQPSNAITFTGTDNPLVVSVQDIALYWSLPAHTYVGSQDRTKNGRENMIASFTPTRALETTNNLFFQEEICYTDIGNLETMNISTIQFRVTNLYPNFKQPLNTNYLSFVLFIKEGERLVY